MEALSNKKVSRKKVMSKLLDDIEPKITKAQFLEDLKTSFREVKQNKTKPLNQL